MYESFDRFLTGLNETFSIVPGVILIILSLAGAFILSFLVRVLLHMVRFNNWIKNTAMIQILRTVGLNPQPHIFISRLVFWIVFLISVEAIARSLNWHSVSGKFNEYLALLPLLVGAIIILVTGLYLSRFIRNSSHAILNHASPNSANILSNALFYILMAITVTISLNYLGVDTGIITTNISIILGSLLLSFSLGFVFASKGILTHILSSSYNKKNFEVGQKIQIGDSKGEIVKITNISVIIKSSDKIEVIPARRFTEEVVQILV